jgi:hypothetical protein
MNHYSTGMFPAVLGNPTEILKAQVMETKAEALQEPSTQAALDKQAGW